MIASPRLRVRVPFSVVHFPRPLTTTICFMPAGSAWIRILGPDVEETIGLIGEVHPEVLDRWGIRFPVAAFELSLNTLHGAVG